MNYSVSSSSSTEELLTLGRILSEVGDYASTILDREHLSLSRRCFTRLKKVVGELISRHCIRSVDNLHDTPVSVPVSSDLKALTIAELYTLYRRRPIRRKEREAESREPFSFYYEDRIVRELNNRKATDKAEQLKIDYCVATYRNELDNMSFVFSRPVKIDDDKIYPDGTRSYTPDELTALIRLYRDYRDIADREILVEYVDYALDWLEDNRDAASGLGLLVEVAELGRRETIRVPKWVNRKLEDAVKLLLVCRTGNDDLAPAMLVLEMINGDSSLIRKAQRIINRCYRSAFDSDEDLGKRIESLYTAVTYCDYVTRFSVRKVAALWNDLTHKALSTDTALTPSQIFRLVYIAGECEDFADISAESKERLKHMLKDSEQSACPETGIYSEIVKLRF